jgi:hypothetical protein
MTRRWLQRLPDGMGCGLHHPARTIRGIEGPSWSGSVPRCSERPGGESGAGRTLDGCTSELSIRGGHKDAGDLAHRAVRRRRELTGERSDERSAQRCRGESGSHVQVAGASLAGNDHSLSSSTLIGRVAGLFCCGPAATGSSFCGSVEDRSSMEETIDRSCRAPHLVARAGCQDSSTRTDACLRRVPRSCSHTPGTAGDRCLGDGVHAAQLHAGTRAIVAVAYAG